MVSNTATVIRLARYLIPDLKNKTSYVRDEELGFTKLATGVRETFYLKHTATSTPQVFIEPHTFTGVATLKSVAGTTKNYLWSSINKSITLGNGSATSTTNGYDPPAGKIVKASYEYNEGLGYSFSDDDMQNMLILSTEMINNLYDKGFEVTGVHPNFAVNADDDNERNLVSLALAIVALDIIITDLVSHGLGSSFRGLMHSLDTREGLRYFRQKREDLLLRLTNELERLKYESGGGHIIDVYTTEEVEE